MNKKPTLTQKYKQLKESYNVITKELVHVNTEKNMIKTEMCKTIDDLEEENRKLYNQYYEISNEKCTIQEKCDFYEKIIKELISRK